MLQASEVSHYMCLREYIILILFSVVLSIFSFSVVYRVGSYEYFWLCTVKFVYPYVGTRVVQFVRDNVDFFVLFMMLIET